MKSLQSIRRLILNVWLAATPLVLMLLTVAFLASIGIVHEIAERMFGTDAADSFLMNVMTLSGLALVLTPVLARWLLRRDTP